MFGPALLIAPVTEQGLTTRSVYLPAGTDWYNFWTSERVRGGQRIVVQAPIDTLPIFVRAGSILPLGEPVESTNELQRIATLRVYPGKDTDFDLYRDDGNTYEYEKGISDTTHLHWSQAQSKLILSGSPLPPGSAPRTEVVGPSPR